jgi:N-acetyl-gamma-glutamyl-phosphate reductase
LVSIDSGKAQGSRGQARVDGPSADLVVLCLHDDAAKESVAMIDCFAWPQTPRIVDASTAHRANDEWVLRFS